MGRNKYLMKNIVLFASGNGSNAEEIIRYFKKNSQGTVVAIFSNKSDAKVLDRAKNHNIPFVVFTKLQLNEGFVLEKLHEFQPDLIVLAGFLLKFPESILKEYPKVINIHPALLPKYGGKGMYGKHVHRAVIENKEIESGITIHLVDEVYDNGEIIFQASCAVSSSETPETLATKIRKLEHEHFPGVVNDFIEKQNHR